MLLFLRKHILQISASVVIALGLLLPAPLVGALAYGEGSYNSCNYNTTNCPSNDSGGSSSSSGSSSTPSTTNDGGSGSEILLNDFSEFFTDSGKTLDLAVGQVVYYNLDVNGTTEKHSVTVKEVNADNVVLLVLASTPQEERLALGETGQYDVTNDGVPDIAITFNIVKDGKASLTFKQLGNASKKTAKTTVSTPATTETAKRNWWPIIIFGGILLLGILWFIWLLARRRRKQKLNNY